MNMTLDEAIKHCEEVAGKNENVSHSLIKDGWQEHFNNLTQEKEAEYKNVREDMAHGCIKCAEEHRQLAEWLKELKGYREAKAKIESLPLAWEYGQGVEDCLAIIDKHLQEVTTDADSN